MEEYLSLTLRSAAGEAEAQFKSRLSTFWTRLLREKPEEFEKVYAEATKFERNGDRLTRQYLIEATVANVLEQELAAAEMEYEPLDRDDIYTRYEASGPDWMQIEH